MQILPTTSWNGIFVNQYAAEQCILCFAKNCTSRRIVECTYVLVCYSSTESDSVKFMFSKKATEIDEIFTDDFTLRA